MDIFKVKVTKKAFKGLEKCPIQAIRKFQLWVSTVENFGLREVRKSSGYHDEPLKGKRLNQRSIRLTKAYRAIYIEDSQGDIKFVEVIEVNKHEY